MRLEAQDLIADGAVPIDVERRGQIVEPHRPFDVFPGGVRDRERKLHLVQVPLQTLRIVIDADQEKRDARIVPVSRICRLQVRQLRTTDPSPGSEEVQEQHLPPQPGGVEVTAVNGRQHQPGQWSVHQAREGQRPAFVAPVRELLIEPGFDGR